MSNANATATIVNKPDSYYTDFIKNTKFLKDVTKNIYLKKIAIVKSNIYPGVSLETILNNPEIFKKNMEVYASKSGRNGGPLGHHTRDTIACSMMSLFLYNQQLREEKYDKYIAWKKVQESIRNPIDNKYKSNEPTTKQKDSYVSYEDIVKVRDGLKPGSFERLLLTMYTEIPPVRSDYYHTKIYKEIPPAFGSGSENHIVLNKKSPFLVLEKYKTAKTYGMMVIDLPQTIITEIEASLKEVPREYLFVSPLGNPFDKENTFNKWANRILKRLFNKKNFTLSMLRHVYISRRDLKLEEKSGLEQEQIAKLMGHSITQQRKYLWHSWLKNMEAGITSTVPAYQSDLATLNGDQKMIPIKIFTPKKAQASAL